MPSRLQYRKIWHKTGLANSSICCMSFSTDGELLALGGSKEVCILTVDTSKVEFVLRAPRSLVIGLEWVKGRQSTLLCTFEDGSIVEIQLRQNGDVDVSRERAASHQIRCYSLDSSSTRLATGSNSDIRVFEREGEWWKEIHRVKPPKTYRDNHLLPVRVVSLHWSKVSRKRNTLIISYRYHGVQAWDITLASFEHSPVLRTNKLIERTSLSPDGSQLAVVMENSFDVHSIAHDSPSYSLNRVGHTSSPAIFIHQGEAIAGAHRKGQIRLWNSVDGTRLQTLFHSNDKEVESIAAFNANLDYFLLATASKDRVILWKAEETTPMLYYRGGDLIAAFFKRPFQIAFAFGVIAFLALASFTSVLNFDNLRALRILPG
ncbi:WD40 repeat-like protein [Panus rudis PR-1116 ss-1]|nr:WD40 repeat-like protein [Panus rudis PR-1116 ss-1]